MELFKDISKNVLYNGFIVKWLYNVNVIFKYCCEINYLIILLKIFKVLYFEYYCLDYGKVRYIWL